MGVMRTEGFFGAVSRARLQADGSFAFYVSSSALGIAVGLNAIDRSARPEEMAHALHFSFGRWRVLEEGIAQTPSDAMPEGLSLWHITRANGRVYYSAGDGYCDAGAGVLLRGQLLCVSAVPSSGEVFLDASLSASQDAVYDAQCLERLEAGVVAAELHAQIAIEALFTEEGAPTEDALHALVAPVVARVHDTPATNARLHASMAGFVASFGDDANDFGLSALIGPLRMQCNELAPVEQVSAAALDVEVGALLARVNCMTWEADGLQSNAPYVEGAFFEEPPEGLQAALPPLLMRSDVRVYADPRIPPAGHVAFFAFLEPLRAGEPQFDVEQSAAAAHDALYCAQLHARAIAQGAARAASALPLTVTMAVQGAQAKCIAGDGLRSMWADAAEGGGHSAESAQGDVYASCAAAARTGDGLLPARTYCSLQTLGARAGADAPWRMAEGAEAGAVARWHWTEAVCMQALSGARASGSAPCALRVKTLPDSLARASGQASGVAFARALAQCGATSLAWARFASDESGCAWLMTTQTAAAYRYTHWPFVSVAQRGDALWAVGPDGLYMISGQQGSDGQAPIAAQVLYGFDDFGSAQVKRVDSLWVAAQTHGALQASCTLHHGADTRKYSYRSTPRASATEVNFRFVPGKALAARHWQLGVGNVDGCDFEVVHMHADVVDGKRRT